MNCFQDCDTLPESTLYDALTASEGGDIWRLGDISSPGDTSSLWSIPISSQGNVNLCQNSSRKSDSIFDQNKIVLLTCNKNLRNYQLVYWMVVTSRSRALNESGNCNLQWKSLHRKPATKFQQNVFTLRLNYHNLTNQSNNIKYYSSLLNKYLR